jgi:hypothetical protein
MKPASALFVIRQIRRWVRFGFGRERSAPEGGSPHRQRRLRSGAVLNQVTFAGMTELPSVRDAPSLTDANTRMPIHEARGGWTM